jgi:hypothetical protein
MAIIEGIKHWKQILKLSKYLVTKLSSAVFKAVVSSRLTEAALGKLAGEDAVKALEESVGKSLAAKLMTKMSVLTLIKTSTEKLAQSATVMAFKEVFGTALGAIGSFTDMTMMLGMVLDSADVAGLNEKMTQSTIDAIVKKMEGGVNNVKEVQDAGIRFPQKMYAQDTFPFKVLTNEQAAIDKMTTDVGDYIGHLTVNSNGEAIIPMFPTTQQKQNAATLSQAQGDFLYTVAGKNLDVYTRLKQDWPIIVAAGLLIIGALIGAGFGIKALVQKKKV